MTDTTKKQQNNGTAKPLSAEEDSVQKKKFPVTTGTAVFLFVNLLLVIGFCKFSFYVLKNHRSAVSRDTLIKTYVDVQPYSGKQKKTASAYITLKSQNKEAPAVFFDSKEAAEQVKAESVKPEMMNAAPTPLYIAKAEQPKISPQVFARPPVIRSRPPVIKETNIINKVAETVLKPQKEVSTISVEKEEAVSLDDLMIAGLDLLKDSDNAILVTEGLLGDEDESVTVALKAETDSVKEIVTKPVAKDAKPAAKAKTTVKKKGDEQTHWVNIAALRESLMSEAEKEGVQKKEQVAKANAALLEMNDSKQVASLKDESVTDSLSVTKSTVPEKDEVKTAVVQDIPIAGTQESKDQKKEDVQPEITQTAVVQDIPFAATQEKTVAKTKEEKSEKSPFITSREQLAAMSGNSSSLWKVAKANTATPMNSLAVKEAAPEDKAITEIRKLALEEMGNSNKETVETPKVASVGQASGEQTVIYRHGRPHIYNKDKSEEETAVSDSSQSLDWLGRQEAAVWTNMSQSDAPSVWTMSSETDKASRDTARAFRIADEQPEPTSESGTSAASVRVVGEDAKPEARANPLLLPLGSASSSGAVGTAPSAASATVPVSSVSTSVGSSGAFPSAVYSAGSPSAGENQQVASGSNEDGLVNRFFSFFGGGNRADTPSVPSVGSGTSSTPALGGGSEKKEEPAKPDAKAAQSTGAAKTASTTQTAAAPKPEKQVIPAELRLTFKPGSAEISAQSVRWIKSFGQQAKKDIQRAVEVRMSNQDYSLQEKRFALIRSTLVGAGMVDEQIIPVMTDRTPHTVVLRMFDLPEEGIVEYTSSDGGIKEQLYYKQW